MTCIVGLVADETVYIGSDSLGTDENGKTLISTYGKIIRIGDFLIGKAGSIRMGQILQYSFKPPEYNSDEYDPRKDTISCYMATLFVEEMKACFEKYALKDDDRGVILVGFKRRLFYISAHNYQIEEDVCGYNAIGCATDIALGSLYTTEGVADWLPGSRVKMALEASEKHNAHVRGPFIIEE